MVYFYFMDILFFLYIDVWLIFPSYLNHILPRLICSCSFAAAKPELKTFLNENLFHVITTVFVLFDIESYFCVSLPLLGKLCLGTFGRALPVVTGCWTAEGGR